MKNRDFLYLILGATFFFAAVSYVLQLPENALLPQLAGGDPISYWEASKLVYTEGSLPHPLRPYFYPFLIGLPTLFFGENGFKLEWALSLNFVFWLSTAVFIFSILKAHTNRKIAFIGAFIFVSNTSNIINCWAVLAETLFHFLIVGSVFFFSKHGNNNAKIGYFSAFVAFFCLSFITRPTYFPLVFILMPLLIWAIYKRYLSLLTVVISVGIFISTVGFSVYKMHKTYGNYTLSYIGNCAFYSFFGAYSKGAKSDKTWDQINDNWRIESHIRSKKMARYVDSIPWSALPPLANADLMDQLKTNKSGLLLTFVRDLASNSTASNGDVLQLTNVKNRPFFAFILRGPFWWSRFQNFVNSLAALLLPFVFWRFKGYFWQNNRPVYWILVVTCALSLFTVLISTVSFSQGDRFHLVILPLNLVSLGILYFFRSYPRITQINTD
jgi:hypothetical protein